MNTGRLYALAQRWREDTRMLCRHGAEPQAELVETHAAELERAVAEWQNEPLTLREAAEEGGLAYSTLQTYLSHGILPNAGKPGRPRIRRCDLPFRGTRSNGPDIADRVLLRRL